MKKTITPVFALVIILTLFRLPLAAHERRGSTVEVTMSDGGRVRGELLAVKEDVLLIRNEGSGTGERLDLGQMMQVKVFKKSKILTGMLIGFVAGLGQSYLSSMQGASHDQGYNFALGMLLRTPVTVLAGGVLGGLAGLRVKFSLAGEPPRQVQLNLERLRHYAREK